MSNEIRRDFGDIRAGEVQLRRKNWCCALDTDVAAVIKSPVDWVEISVVELGELTLENRTEPDALRAWGAPADPRTRACRNV